MSQASLTEARRPSAVKLASLVLSVMSTIILACRKLNLWTGVAFSLVVVVMLMLLNLYLRGGPDGFLWKIRNTGSIDCATS